MDLRSMIAFLITSLPKGSKSAAVTDFSSVKGQISDPSNQRVYELEITLCESSDGNIWVLDLGKIWKARGYKQQQYHAVFQQDYLENEETGEYKYLGYNEGPIRNSWGHHEKVICQSDAKK